MIPTRCPMIGNFGPNNGGSLGSDFELVAHCTNNPNTITSAAVRTYGLPYRAISPEASIKIVLVDILTGVTFTVK